MWQAWPIYALAAACEIAGCFAVWAWLRLGRSWLWCLPGVVALMLFALLLTRIDTPAAGRAYAAYGGAYVLASVLWQRLAEGIAPDRWDLIGAFVCIAGAAIILLGPRAA